MIVIRLKKDLRLVEKQGKKLDKLRKVIEKLANKIPLDAKYKDHELIDNYI